MPRRLAGVRYGVPGTCRRGASQEKLPLYLGLFEFVHNVRKRGKALLGALIELLVTPTPCETQDEPF